MQVVGNLLLRFIVIYTEFAYTWKIHKYHLLIMVPNGVIMNAETVPYGTINKEVV